MEQYRASVFAFAETEYVLTEPASHRYLTSQRPVVALAKLVNSLVSPAGSFDIRALGSCNLALYLGAVYLLLRTFRRASLPRRLCVAGAVVLIATDVKLVAYFNSFYCESASLVFLFATLGFALLGLAGERRGQAAWWLWLGYLGSSFLFWMAKSQNTVFAPILAIGAWYLFPSTPIPARRLLRLLAGLAIPVEVGCAFLAGAYGESVHTNARVVVIEEIIPHSPSPAADWRELATDSDQPSVYRIARFYARHPVRWWQMARRQATEAFSSLPLGNFSRASGLPAGAQSRAFSFWSELKRGHYPRNLPWLLVLLVAYASFAGAKARWLDPDRASRARTVAGLLLAVGCALELVVTVTFEANGTAKHLFLFNVAFDLCTLLALLALADAVVLLRQRYSGATTPSAPDETRQMGTRGRDGSVAQ